MKRTRLTDKQLHSRVAKRLEKIFELNHLECFAMFIGKAQLIEMALKNLLSTKYHYQENKIERWTLGKVIQKLEALGLRADFISQLKELNRYRTHMAHDYLADYALTTRLKAPGLTQKRLREGLYVVEATIIVHDFLVSNKYLTTISRTH
jgi:hypothetical protein